jgi:hypothetical protein
VHEGARSSSVCVVVRRRRVHAFDIGHLKDRKTLPYAFVKVAQSS